MFGEFSKGIYDHTEPPRNPVYWAKDRVVTICRDVVTTLLQDTLPEMVPDMVDSAVAAMNSLLPFYRSSWWPYRVFLPKAMTQASCAQCHATCWLKLIHNPSHRDLELAQV